MSNIYDVANELNRRLRALPEYQAVVQAKEEIAKNPEAQAIFEEYIAFQNELQRMAQTGQAPEADLEGRMREFSEKIQGNELVSNFFAKEQQLGVYLSDLERIVFEPVQELLQ
ncbi:YlbF/YmcA family competence regulator [Streptococcus sp. 121]|uniref:YlbF/YmcA family competence regulator n=1 Tax=Streptococcus sp. 121 TaxID=2797637 RepID=UPI0018F08633|nr:YlbF/YmcA family competence regulator [Streptococcus sp. 121]MBJ6745249.1 YlbF/YmcA family competence regulator [Streptococcus sp. 121]